MAALASPVAAAALSPITTDNSNRAPAKPFAKTVSANKSPAKMENATTHTIWRIPKLNNHNFKTWAAISANQCLAIISCNQWEDSVAWILASHLLVCLRCQAFKTCKVTLVDLDKVSGIQWIRYQNWCIPWKPTQIPICNHRVGVPILRQEWVETINYIKEVDKNPKKLNVETVPVILLRAKMVNVISKTPVTNKLNTHLQNHNSLQNLHKKDKCNKMLKMQENLSQQSQFQLRNNEINLVKF